MIDSLQGSATKSIFFSGDGPGVGKSRIIAGVLKYLWEEGLKKSIWLTISSDLSWEIQDDLTSVGIEHCPVFTLDELRKNFKLKGLLIVSYNQLLAGKKEKINNFDLIVKFCGPKFNGLVSEIACENMFSIYPFKYKKKNFRMNYDWFKEKLFESQRCFNITSEI